MRNTLLVHNFTYHLNKPVDLTFKYGYWNSKGTIRHVPLTTIMKKKVIKSISLLYEHTFPFPEFYNSVT